MTTATETTLTPANTFAGVTGLYDLSTIGPGGLPLAWTPLSGLLRAVAELRDQGFSELALLTAEEQASDGEPCLNMVYGLQRTDDNALVFLKVALTEDSLSVPSLSGVWKGAAPLEREVYDLFGVDFADHPGLRRIVLRDDFVGHPLRKSFVLGESGVTRAQVEAALASHGDAARTEQTGEAPFAEVNKPGDPVLRSERLILNMGPQHPSTHGVLHVWLALEGEHVLAAEPTHGYLHRCIEKLCEHRSYRACTALMDRCDYVSGFHTEHAYMMALEDLAGIEVTPKAEYLRVLFDELVRITSHHTWYAAAGLDTGALTPFLYAFIDREKILDFFETVTGARMMFNYLRPGGVKEDIQPDVAEKIRRFCKGFGDSLDEYEALLSGNEIFRARTRGVGILPRAAVSSYGVTGPMARASGVDRDLRRDEPYSAYRDIKVNVPLGEAGDTFDRYAVRIAEMRESARIAIQALEGMPEGPFLSEGVPRNLKPPVGAAYRRVESSRGELGVYLVSDGSAEPWRLKVRSPAFSNLHSAPLMLENVRFGDVVAVLGSVDVVMGEIDR